MKSSNSWAYRDKQITELSRTQQRTHSFSDEEEEDYGLEARSFDSLQPKHKPKRGSLRNWSLADGVGFLEADLISEIDRNIKEHVDNVLHVVEGLSARITQLESRMHQVENGIDDLKVAIEYNHGKTDEKLRQLDNILGEVQGGVKDLGDKQEIAESRLQLTKLHLSKGDPQLGKQDSTSKNESTRGALSFVAKQSQLLPNPEQPVAPPSSTQNLHHQNPLPIPAATAPQLRSQLLQNFISSFLQHESYRTSTVPIPETTYQQYHTPPSQQSLPPPAVLHQPNQPNPTEAIHQQYCITSLQQSQPPPATIYQPHPPSPQPPSDSQLDQPPKQHQLFSSGFYRPSSQHPGEVPNLPPHRIQQSSLPPAGFPPTHQFYGGSTQQVHGQNPSRRHSEFPSGYSLPQEHSNSETFYLYDASPFGSSCTNMKHIRPASSPSEPRSGNSYSQLPTAKILPRAIPMASSVDKASASGGTADRVPTDDVIDKVVAMGFRRDLVRTTVRKLTENGQSVDLNAVLDKLMNNG